MRRQSRAHLDARLLANTSAMQGTRWVDLPRGVPCIEMEDVKRTRAAAVGWRTLLPLVAAFEARGGASCQSSAHAHSSRSAQSLPGCPRVPTTPYPGHQAVFLPEMAPSVASDTARVGWHAVGDDSL